MEIPGPLPQPYNNLYSSSGFDLIGVLSRVVSRPNPAIQLGPIDLSCSFIVADARRPDIPIVYVSPTFEKLTGFPASEIENRNCRFLQSPEAMVMQAENRKYTDGKAVGKLKEHQDRRLECQVSLINYRKGGQPFVNLITVIPITWESEQVAFFVGFQVDLVEQPNAILKRMKNGSYAINYQLTYPPQDLSHSAPQVEDLMEIIDLNDRSDKESAQRLWSRHLIENSDDLVHIMTLEGTIVYSSPASRDILGYEPARLMGSNVRDFCHPSDLVPTMREIRIASTGASNTINLLYRVLGKSAGYIWLEMYGKIYREPGKGKKYLILIGREKKIPYLSSAMLSTLGHQEKDVWMKASLEGIILFATSNSDYWIAKTMYEVSKDPDRIKEAIKHCLEGQVVSISHQLKTLQNVVSCFIPGQGPNVAPWFLFVRTRYLEATDTPPEDSSTAYIHDGGLNLFEMLESTRSTSWQYELNQLKITNKKLKEQIAKLTGKKRAEVE
ncbi:White collar 1 protein [Neolecta irregularis DAH-3]|uniref:White collar 1 protein n=1 Tax=Neolecta irregularis (strain DAH-3) TaxID=1198029 RepID=A0A1U7LMW6_NEOID|nr:White collar 1 protein [Neolecta irregularis DAH-3]|eukprot:OLL23923.1 White collar 1 protein [Neolecta irregularis DAH-3]